MHSTACTQCLVGQRSECVDLALTCAANELHSRGLSRGQRHYQVERGHPNDREPGAAQDVRARIKREMDMHRGGAEQIMRANDSGDSMHRLRNIPRKTQLEIYERHSRGQTASQLAREYNIGAPTVRYIWRRWDASPYVSAGL